MTLSPTLGRFPISWPSDARDRTGLTEAGLTSDSDQPSTGVTESNGVATGAHGVFSFLDWTCGAKNALPRVRISRVLVLIRPPVLPD